MTAYFIAYAVVAATVAVATFAYVERWRHAQTPTMLTVAASSLALGALWPVLPLAMVQMTLIAWLAASLRRRDEPVLTDDVLHSARVLPFPFEAAC